MKKLVEPLNFTINLDELKSYYTILKEQFAERNWSYNDNTTDVREDIYNFNTENSNDRNANGWAITVPKFLNTNEQVAPWLNIHKDFVYGKEHIQVEHRTPMVFGIVEKLLTVFPYAKNVALTVFEPGAQFVPHKDEDYLLRVHIPIYTSNKSRWLTEDGYEPINKAGQAYLCDTRELHSVYNDGDSDRVHLIFAIETQYEDEIKKVKGQI
jgi:hypothetical protein